MPVLWQNDKVKAKTGEQMITRTRRAPAAPPVEPIVARRRKAKEPSTQKSVKRERRVWDDDETVLGVNMARLKSDTYDPLRPDKVRLVNDLTLEDKAKIRAACMKKMQERFGPNGGTGIITVKIMAKERL